LSRGRVARGNLTILVILALPGKDVTPPDGNSMLLLCAFVFGAVVFAAVWLRFLRRGPWSTYSTAPRNCRSSLAEGRPIP